LHAIGQHRVNEFIRGPKWRTRTSPGRRARAAAATFALVVVTGLAIVGALVWIVDRLGAPTWLSVLPWLVPTVGAIAWATIRPEPAVATDDDDDGWFDYSIRYVIIGAGTPRQVPSRVIAAVLFGAPVAWALAVFGLSTLAGLF
jgi:hypothetical protein